MALFKQLKRSTVLNMLKKRTFFSQPSSTSASQVSNSVRSAQAVETFRSAYYKAASSPTNVSLSDIHQVLITERVRPSLLINVYEGLGHLSGSIARTLPVKKVNEIFTQAIDDAASQQLNDSVRILADNPNDEVKEMLKFHRDIRASERSTETNESSENKDSGECSSTFHSAHNMDPKVVLSTALHQVFKISEII